MAPSKKEAIVLVVDIRKSEADQSGSNVTFSKVSECAKNIISRKIMSKSNDDMALLILGSERSNNCENFKNIEVVRHLEHPTWNMMEDRTGGAESASDCGGDVVEAIIVAMSMLNKSYYKAMKIVLISHACGSSQPRLGDLIEQLNEMKVQVTVIGPNMEELSQIGMEVDGAPMSELSTVTCIAVKTNGLVCGFEDALEQLTNFEKKKVEGARWKAGLEIGGELVIPVFGIKKVSPEDDIKAKVIRVSGEDDSRVERDYVYTVQSSTTTDEKPVEKQEIVDGYKFGTTIIPYSVDEQAVLDYKSGSRSLKVLFFTNAKNIPPCLYVGSGQYFFFPSDERSKPAFSALVKAMAEENHVAIVRKVYNNNNTPSLGVLSPKIKGECTCLTYIALPFADDIQRSWFGPLKTKKSQPSQELLDSIDELISNMDLMVDVDENGEVSEAFHPKETRDPCQQYVYEVICDRALNPNKKELLKPSEKVLQMLAPPSDLQERMKPTLDKIKSLCPLVERKPKEGARKAAAHVFKKGPEDFEAEDVEEKEEKPSVSTLTKTEIEMKIGHLTPVEDFNRMLEQNQILLKEACGQMQDIILRRVEHAFDLDDMKKTVPLVGTMRAACIKQDPSIFNSWVSELIHLTPSKITFLKLLLDENVALITREESELSELPVEANNLLREKAISFQQTPAEDDDVDDMLNEMWNS